MNIQYKVLKASSVEELQKIIQLRVKILRAPWKQPAETATDEFESNAINAYVLNDLNAVIACGRLQINSEETGQIRFMAVDENYQGLGLGKHILSFLEEEVKKINLKYIELQARENAVSFYEKNGYHIVEKSFLLWGIIQHFKMVKKIN
ncbi:MAG: GNAT family N-acetyltransferase [Sphingobacteriaceae bacterium]|nr:GNAT family N-acetyltransferase [Sphingobacteriaceae bacterium]